MRVSRTLFATGVVALVTACSSSDSPNGNAAAPLANAGPVVATYAKNVYASYSDALAGATGLQTAIESFTAAPSEETHQAAKDAYKAARVPYMTTEAFRFYDGPIDNTTNGPEADINSWPLDENFIDYTRDDPNAGIVNDPTIVLTKDALKRKNASGGDKNIATGYHAIEFLLWGQDDKDPLLKTQGHRSFTDYTTLKNADRRKQYLELVADLLVDELTQVTNAWAPNADNYAKTFVADPKAALTSLLTGVGSLANAELAGQRMTVAYVDRDQEDEHSCFSDLTNADLQGNFLGIQNVYMGTYKSDSGPSVSSLVAAVDPALDNQIKSDLAMTAAAFVAMQAEPFDYAIAQPDGSPPRDAILHAIQGVNKLAADVPLIGAKLGLTFKLDEPTTKL